ncbi:hypothetical protein [Streptomyces sp. NPDC046821]|uniref:hypothetical protein n=1 Tax=Streptomyces sp. NPDC046821 TaxID=3154702 RepID=UPI0033E418FA
MAHAAPVSGTSGLRSTVTGSRLSIVLSLLLGAVYGIWAAGIKRDATPITGAVASPYVTGGNIAFGFVTGIIVAAVCYGVHMFLRSSRMQRELRAAVWAVFGGCAFGFIYSLTDASVLRSTIMALIVAVGVGAGTFYHYYTTE